MSSQSPELVPVTCRVCEAATSQRRVCTKDGFHVVRCESCGFVFLNPRPTPEWMRHAYGEDYFDSGGTDGGYTDYLARGDLYRKTFRGRIRRALRYKRGGRLLDIGCGPGFALDAAESLGFEPWGLDVSPYAVSIASERHGDRVACGELTPGRFPAEFFDVVTMFDLLEHIYEPRKFLDAVAETLPADGILVINTPNYEGLLARLSGSRWVSFKLPEHVSFYTPRTLGALVAGRFRILKVTPGGQHSTVAFVADRVAQLSSLAGRVLWSLVRLAHLQERAFFAYNGSMTVLLQRVGIAHQSAAAS